LLRTRPSAPVIESKQVSTSINTNEEVLTSIQKLKIGQPDEKSYVKVESKETTARPDSQDDDGDIIMENSENDESIKNSNNVENGHKLVPPEIKLDTSLVGVAGETTLTQISNRTTTVSSVSFVAPAPVKDRAPSHITREIKQPKAPRREKEIKEIKEIKETKEIKENREVRESNTNKDENEHQIVNNGEGPSYVTAEDPSVSISSTTSRKRKFDEMDDEGEINDLKEKLAALDQVSKRRKWDIVISTCLGLVAGVAGMGACAYMFGA
jgi:hypothetical protein